MITVVLPFSFMMAASTEQNVKIVDISAAKGKGLLASQSFKKGDILFDEKPLVSAQFSWNEFYKYQTCEYCLRSLETAEEMARRLSNNSGLNIPHPECCEIDPSKFAQCLQCQTLYCSTACRDLAANQYHKVLCKGLSKDDPAHPLNKLDHEWRNLHFPPETTSIMLIVKMIAMIKQASDKDEALSQFADFVQRTYDEESQIAHKLLKEKFEVHRDILRNLLMEVIFDESVQEWFTPIGFSSLFALVGTNGQGIGSSSFSQWVKNTESLHLGDAEKKQLDLEIEKIYEQIEEVSGEFLDCEGSGLYKLQSACNHSCVPNAEIAFLHGDHTLSLIALKDIAPEEEITISYLDCCDIDRSRHSRQKTLRENYLFQCSCEKCLSQADDASVTSDEQVDDDDDDDDMEDEGGE